MKKTILTTVIALICLTSGAQTSKVITDIKIVKFAYPLNLKQDLNGNDTVTYLAFENAEYYYIKDDAVLIIEDMTAFIKSLEAALILSTSKGIKHIDGNISTSDRNSFITITSGYKYTILEGFQTRKLIKKLNKLNK